MVETKTIRLTEDTKNDLDTLGNKGESYEDIIKRTITFTKKFNNESDFTEWFKENYALFGFTKILKQSTRSTPDFILLSNDGMETKVELETMASNFIHHGHTPSEVDLVICLVKDVNLPVPVLEIETFDFAKKSTQSVYLNESVLQQIEKIKTYFSKKFYYNPSTTGVISAALKVYEGTLEVYEKTLKDSDTGGVEKSIETLKENTT